MSMDYVNLGKTGLKVSRICLGCMTYGGAGGVRPGSQPGRLNEEQSQPFIKQALEVGINFFDTANVYSTGTSEEIVGAISEGDCEARRHGDRDEGARRMRDEPNGKGLSRKAIMIEMDESLQPPAAWTTWTFTRFIAGTTRRRSRRRWRRCTMW